MDRLSELLGQAVQFAYTCWDRIVLSGYLERLQRRAHNIQKKDRSLQLGRNCGPVLHWD